ncbi:NUDIX hydrolase [Sulfitobacter mediterraneus]|uniref:NUDIX domain-containing protein n=1 Tax=Sulfitobacter mediterraneus TaxID=83219 RepID=UPI0019347B88|nr:NUDIX hydrolase [Sulfitobacter mediterraneus]MBM1310527.1 NUDIX hydrolase [Sulfitobacter mediterraneus]MBM1314411.1 NUDIX hydrolase [Sulfitobacter mediterraneus]MBM1322771.1 NUDIX hydrolase [Sulfitobacter mediterraneus]MBM1326683.1 NUDIX hydrolase [Sulfitobacter mediterraneus]MBM1398029.1 NUDIX hydrolase [Sulfitobacter mediterraneus]
MSEYPRVAVRAILIHENKLLLVNAYANGQSALMCPPGGGVEAGSSLPENLCREVFEETGLRIEVGAPCLVNEFHDPGGSFHQVDIYFRCSVIGSAEIDSNWQDTDSIVTDRRWVTAEELANVHHKPDSLGAVAFDPQNGITYDPLEPLVR